jgi:hypothetical protein
MPGARRRTRTPSGRSSISSVSAREWSAALDALYGPYHGDGLGPGQRGRGPGWWEDAQVAGDGAGEDDETGLAGRHVGHDRLRGEISGEERMHGV